MQFSSTSRFRSSRRPEQLSKKPSPFSSSSSDREGIWFTDDHLSAYTFPKFKNYKKLNALKALKIVEFIYRNQYNQVAREFIPRILIQLSHSLLSNPFGERILAKFSENDIKWRLDDSLGFLESCGMIDLEKLADALATTGEIRAGKRRGKQECSGAIGLLVRFHNEVYDNNERRLRKTANDEFDLDHLITGYNHEDILVYLGAWSFSFLRLITGKGRSLVRFYQRGGTFERLFEQIYERPGLDFPCLSEETLEDICNHFYLTRGKDVQLLILEITAISYRIREKGRDYKCDVSTIYNLVGSLHCYEIPIWSWASRCSKLVGISPMMIIADLRMLETAESVGLVAKFVRRYLPEDYQQLPASVRNDLESRFIGGYTVTTTSTQNANEDDAMPIKSIFWPIARFINANYLKILGRKNNEDLMKCLICLHNENVAYHKRIGMGRHTSFQMPKGNLSMEKAIRSARNLSQIYNNP